MINFLIQTGAFTVSKNLIGGLLMSATTLVAAPDAPTAKPMSFDASVYVTQQGKIRLSVEKAMPGTVSVQLIDQNKNVLYSDALGKKQQKAAVLFDMSEMQDGAYTLEIKSGENSIQKQVNLKTSKQERLIDLH